MMGCLHKTKRSPHAGVPAYFDLPEPLPDGAPKRTVGSGANIVELWNPDWFSPVNEGVNVDFIAATINLVIQSGGKPIEPTVTVSGHLNDWHEGSTYSLKSEWLQEPALIKLTAESYFRHLRRQYKYRKDPEAVRRLAAKMKMDKRLSRRDRVRTLCAGDVH